MVDHVKTQLPYACLNGIIAFITFIVAGITGSPISLALAIILLIICVFTWNTFESKKSHIKSFK